MARAVLTGLVLWLTSLTVTSGELLKNGGFESLDGWNCYGSKCTLSSSDKRSGHYGVKVTGRSQTWQGPGQFVEVTCGQPSYQASGYVRLITDQGPQTLQIVVDFKFTDQSHQYDNIAIRRNARVSDGWVYLKGSFTLPTHKTVDTVRVYISGPEAGVDFAVDDASVIAETCHCDVPLTSEQVIEQIRKSDINIHVTTSKSINREDIQIKIHQVKKSFPFGTAVSAPKYNGNAAGGKYREVIHRHFNWAVIENSLKWKQIERRRGSPNYQPALDTLHGLRSHGLKVRGHTLVWPKEDHIPNWVKRLHGQELRDAVSHHIHDIMNVTKGLVEHWDVSNENVHGQWFQDRLGDPDYLLELFRMTHHNDPSVRLFLNDYNVVAAGYSTDKYLEQAREVSGAYVGLHALGAQCHFRLEVRPDPVLIKQRLDTLSRSGLPIWATELDVQSADEDTRADFYEAALRALYGHPAVEGILVWGFWDQSHWKGEKAALFKGNGMEPTAAGLRVLDLLENQWMTSEARDLSQSGDRFTVRGFHGDYEVRVYNQGTEVTSLRSTFTLGKKAHNLNIHI